MSFLFFAIMLLVIKMFETRTWVFMGVTLFLGLFQFIISLILLKEKPDTKRDEFMHMGFKQWGRRGLTFGIVMTCAYILKEDAAVLILILSVILIMYNGMLLRKMMKKVDVVFPLNDPNGEQEIDKDKLLK